GSSPYDSQKPYCGYNGKLVAQNGTLIEAATSAYCVCVPEYDCKFWYREGRFVDYLDKSQHVGCNQSGELYWDGVAPHRDSDWCICQDRKTPAIECPQGQTYKYTGGSPYDSQSPYCGYNGKLVAQNGTLLEAATSQYCACVPEYDCKFWYRGGRFVDYLDKSQHVNCNQQGQLYWDGVAPHRDSDWCICQDRKTASVSCPTGQAYQYIGGSPYAAQNPYCGYNGKLVSKTTGVQLETATSAYCVCTQEYMCNFWYRGGRFVEYLEAQYIKLAGIHHSQKIFLYHIELKEYNQNKLNH
ncbi:MAG: hypothetical protein HQK51_21940, partial [Oligoflexia bacterium]|nr:hypothetical protein [Oligoflexia bacterium]